MRARDGLLQRDRAVCRRVAAQPDRGRPDRARRRACPSECRQRELIGGSVPEGDRVAERAASVLGGGQDIVPDDTVRARWVCLVPKGVTIAAGQPARHLQCDVIRLLGLDHDGRAETQEDTRIPGCLPDSSWLSSVQRNAEASTAIRDVDGSSRPVRERVRDHHVEVVALPAKVEAGALSLDRRIGIGSGSCPQVTPDRQETREQNGASSLSEHLGFSDWGPQVWHSPGQVVHRPRDLRSTATRSSRKSRRRSSGRTGT